MRRLRQGRSSQWRKLRNLHRLSSIAGDASESAAAPKRSSPLKPPTPYGPRAEQNILLSQVLSLQVHDAAAAAKQDAEGAAPGPRLSEDEDEGKRTRIWTQSVEMRAMNERVRNSDNSLFIAFPNGCCIVAVTKGCAPVGVCCAQLDSLEAGQQILANAIEQLPIQIASLISTQLQDSLGAELREDARSGTSPSPSV
jgi:hypothetical protein